MSQVKSVTKTVLIDGQKTSCYQPSQEVLSVAQIIVSQTSKLSKRKVLNGTSQLKKGNVKPGTPLLQYVGLKISHTTQSPKLIDDIYHVGLRVKLRFGVEQDFLRGFAAILHHS